MTILTTREQRRQLERDNAKLPTVLQPFPIESKVDGPMQAWRSRDYLVQIYAAPAPAVVRLSMHRTTLGADGRWLDGIPWEELQRLKGECGYADFDAIEIHPKQRDVVNVANIRHLWVMQDPIEFAWRKA